MNESVQYLRGFDWIEFFHGYIIQAHLQQIFLGSSLYMYVYNATKDIYSSS